MRRFPIGALVELVSPEGYELRGRVSGYDASGRVIVRTALQAGPVDSAWRVYLLDGGSR